MSTNLPNSQKTKNKLLIRYILIFILSLMLIGLLLSTRYDDEIKNIFRQKPNQEEKVMQQTEIDLDKANSEELNTEDEIKEEDDVEAELEMEGIEIEFEGFSPEEVTLPSVDIPADLTDNITKESDEEELSTNVNPDIDLSGPEIEKKTNFTSYKYTIKLSESGIEKYSNGIRYYIDPDECLYEDMIVGEDTFEGEFIEILESNEINIYIQDKFLDPTKEMSESKYEITDLGDEMITTGSIQVPTCKESNEKNRYGEFSIDKPIKDITLLQGFHHFDYYFTYDEKAKKNLEEGFTYHVEADKCLAEGMNPEDYYFVGEFPSGELNTIGFGVNIKSESLPDDDGQLYVTSLYTISSPDGTNLFSGYVQVPNCE